MSKEMEELRSVLFRILERLDEIEEQPSETAQIEERPDVLEDVLKDAEPEPTQEERVSADTDAPYDLSVTQEAQLVSLVGIKSGIGVTHHCILLASYLQNAGISVAVVDFSGAEGMEHGSIPHFKGDLQMLDKIAYEYQIILLDLGCFASCDRSFFRRSNKKIVMAGYKPWERGYINQIFDTIPADELKRYCYIFNHVQDAEKTAILEGMRPIQGVYFAGITQDPYKDFEDSVAEKIFPEYMAAKNIKNGRKRNVKFKKKAK